MKKIVLIFSFNDDSEADQGIAAIGKEIQQAETVGLDDVSNMLTAVSGTSVKTTAQLITIQGI